MVGSAQEAKVTITMPSGALFNLLTALAPLERARYFIVSDAVIGLGQETTATVVRLGGQNCDRCWNYFDELHEVEEHHVCSRCLEALGQ